jgi:hypothetical protein
LFAPEPLAVQQVRACEVDAEARRLQMVDRITVKDFGRSTFS